ncbi:uncharacterized protein [Ambystoma mexicanum]|uniref:uncharacterized protein n=1 Tax=Ambystoma mexicanum TaxID=8296 RepID=UPI0037E781DC
MEEHDKVLDTVLRIFEEKGITLREEKCEFGVSKVEYLGHEVSSEGVKTKGSLVNLIKEVNKPANNAELRSFLGMTEFYQKCVENYTIKVVEMRRLLKKGAEFVWNERCGMEFQRIKDEINLAQP